MGTTYATRLKGIEVRTVGADDESWEFVSARHNEALAEVVKQRRRKVHAPGQSFRKKKPQG